jgi:hypothetical protein
VKLGLASGVGLAGLVNLIVLAHGNGGQDQQTVTSAPTAEVSPYRVSLGGLLIPEALNPLPTTALITPFPLDSIHEYA